MALLPSPQQQLSARGSGRSSSGIATRAPVLRRGPVAVRAASLPSGVSAPKRQPVAPEPKFGFVNNAERLNSRAAMIGFMATLIIEAVAHRGLLEMAGFSIGQGLGFEL